MQYKACVLYFAHFNGCTCGGDSYRRTPLTVTHTVPSSHPKLVLCLWHQPFNGVAEGKSTKKHN